MGTDLADGAGQLVDVGADLGGVLVGDGRQVAHLVGHHREAATALAGARRLDGRVERQQVGLAGDLLDHLDDGLDAQTRLAQLVGAAHHVLGLFGEVLHGAVGLTGDLALLQDVARQIVHAAVQFAGVVPQLLADLLATLVCLAQHLAEIREAAEHRLDGVVEALGIHHPGEVLPLEFVDLVDHHLAQPGQLLDLPAQEEGLELAVVGGEVVDVVVAEGRTLRGTEKEHCGERLVEVQAEDLAKGGKAHHRRLAEHLAHARQLGAVVGAAQDAVVEHAHQRGAALALQEAGEILAGGVHQGGALDHHQLFAGRHVAEQVDALALVIDAGDGADEQLIAHADGEGIVRQALLQLLGPAAQGLAEGRHHALDLAAAVDHLADVALFQGGGEDTEAERRGAEVLALEHPEAGVPGHLQEDQLGMVFIGLAAIVQQRLAEVTLAAGGTADEQAGEAAGLVQRLHEEGFRGGQAVEQHEGQGIAVIDGRAHLQALERLGQAGEAFLHAAPRSATADVLAVQRNVHHLGRGDDRGVEELQHQPVPGAIGGAIQALLAAAEFAGGGAQADGCAGKAPRQLPGDGVQVQVWRNEAGDIGGLEGDAAEAVAEFASGAGQAEHAATALAGTRAEALQKPHDCSSCLAGWERELTQASARLPAA